MLWRESRRLVMNEKEVIIHRAPGVLGLGESISQGLGSSLANVIKLSY